MNKSRWRFVLKNYSPREILRALRYEARWLCNMMPRSEIPRFLRPLGRAYLATVFNLPFILYDRGHRFLPLDGAGTNSS
jgi:hypothetical protein